MSDKPSKKSNETSKNLANLIFISSLGILSPLSYWEIDEVAISSCWANWDWVKDNYSLNIFNLSDNIDIITPLSYKIISYFLLKVNFFHKFVKICWQLRLTVILFLKQ